MFSLREIDHLLTKHKVKNLIIITVHDNHLFIHLFTSGFTAHQYSHKYNTVSIHIGKWNRKIDKICKFKATIQSHIQDV